MFTIKLYRGARQDISEVESFTIIRFDGNDEAAPVPEPPHVEITLHRSDIRSDRVDVYPYIADGADQSGPPRFDRAIIENRFGKTTEVIDCRQIPAVPMRGRRAA